MSRPEDTWRPKQNPWDPPDGGEAVVYAIRALADGKANDGQQKLIWNWLGYITGTGDSFADLSFRPGEDGRRNTDFAEGKRFVGLQIPKQLHPALTPKPKPDRQER